MDKNFEKKFNNKFELVNEYKEIRGNISNYLTQISHKFLKDQKYS